MLTATFDNAIWTLPKCGRMAWENGVPRPDPTWLFDVQAHPPTAVPAPNIVEDGQLLILRRNP